MLNKIFLIVIFLSFMFFGYDSLEKTEQIKEITVEQAAKLVQDISKSELDNIYYQGKDDSQQTYRFSILNEDYQDTYIVNLNSGDITLIEDRYRLFDEPLIISNKKVIVNEDMISLIDFLGKPLLEENKKDDCGTYYFYEYENLSILFLQKEEGNNILHRFEVATSNIETYRQVSLGNNSEDILDKYGNPDYDYLTKEGNRILSYAKSGNALWFELKDNKTIKFGISHENQC